MARSTKVSISKGVSTVRAVMFGQTVHGMWATGRKIKSTGRASMSGSTVVVTKAIGRATIWTVTVCTPGKTAESTRASI
jgi:selenophosphate synthase